MAQPAAALYEHRQQATPSPAIGSVGSAAAPWQAVPAAASLAEVCRKGSGSRGLIGCWIHSGLPLVAHVDESGVEYC